MFRNPINFYLTNESYFQSLFFNLDLIELKLKSNLIVYKFNILFKVIQNNFILQNLVSRFRFFKKTRYFLILLRLYNPLLQFIDKFMKAISFILNCNRLFFIDWTFKCAFHPLLFSSYFLFLPSVISST